MQFPRPSAHSGPALFRKSKFVAGFLKQLEALFNLTVSPAGIGKLTVSENTVVLDLTQLFNLLTQGTQKPLQLYNASTESGARIGVTPGNVGPLIPSGFEDPPFTLTVSGSGVVYAHWSIDVDTGDINSVEITHGSDIPGNDTDGGDYYYGIGIYSVSGSVVTCANSAYGPLNLVSCLVPFSNPATYQSYVIGAGA